MRFELNSVFAKLGLARPPHNPPADNRYVADALAQPHVTFYNPDALHFPDHTMPVIPGNGGYAPMGSPVVYDGQAQWDRSKVYEAGPVREFFQNMMHDTRIKHV